MQHTPNWNPISLQQVQTLFSNRVDAQCSVAKLEQTNRGFVNKTYAITLSDSRQFILKMMNPTWYRNKTYNEIIAMHLFKTKANLPVPNVISWECDRKKSEIGYEFIVMEKVCGIPLESCWETLSSQQKVDVLNQLVQMLLQMRQTKLDRIGNFYLSTVSQNEQSKVEDVSVVVSPLVAFQQQSDSTDSPSIVGPFTNFAEYILAYFDVHYDIMVQQADPEIAFLLEPLKKFRMVIETFKESLGSQQDEHFCLTHADLTSSNIMVNLQVDKCIICGIIDWEWAMCAPCDVEFQRGFNFIKSNSDMASVFWKMLHDNNIETKMTLDHFLHGIRGIGSMDDTRHHIFVVERLVSKLVYLAVYYQDPLQQKQLKEDYLLLIRKILAMYQCCTVEDK